MDLKDFIKETITGLVEASRELQCKFEYDGILINPPVSIKEPELYFHGDSRHVYRRVERIEFDVAVSASSETSGGGKGGLKVLSFEAGVDGQHSHQNEQVSRVKFSIPVVLSPSDVEEKNKAAARAEQAARAQKTVQAQERLNADTSNSWIEP